MGAATHDYLGWTVHFTHAEPGTACSTAPDLVSMGDIIITTDQIDTDPANHAGHAQRATLGGVISSFPASITTTFALFTTQTVTATNGAVTITNFDDDTIEGNFTVTGTYWNSTSPATATGTFSATRCLE